MSGTLIQITQLILSLAILVTLHELGHFLAAKYFKTRVDKFMLFFDPWFALFKKKVGDTTYGIGWLPLGGYVKIAGMIDESMDKEQLKQEPQPWEFRSKPAWQRLIIMLAGVFVNVILAWFIYTCILLVWNGNYVSMDQLQKNGLEFTEPMKQAGFEDGDKILTVNGKKQERANRMIIDILLADSVTVERGGAEKTIVFNDSKIKSILNGAQKLGLFSPLVTEVIVDSLIPGGQAEKAGILANDRLIAVDRQQITGFSDLRDQLSNHKSDSVQITLLRESRELTMPVMVSDSASLGFYRQGPSEEFINNMIVEKEYNLGGAISAAWGETFTNLIYQIKQFKLIIRPKTEAYKQVSGPLRLFKVFAPTWDWRRFWEFTAMFSIWLAFLNLLPIPALDGGHALFTIIEMITGRKMSEKTLETAQIIGFFILVGLMLLVFGNDIYRLIVD